MQDADGGSTPPARGAEHILRADGGSDVGRTSSDPRWRAVREDGSLFPGEEHPPMIARRTGKPRAVIMGIHRPDVRWSGHQRQPLLDGMGKGVVSSFFDAARRRAGALMASKRKRSGH